VPHKRENSFVATDYRSREMMERLSAKECGFCHGSGKVRRYARFAFSICQVCSGRGKVYLREPVVICAFCQGTGVQPNTYPCALLSCAACRGKGVVTLKEPSILCPDCSGRGRVVDGKVYCLTCKGKGRIEVEERMRRGETGD
jgi:DnaJ-class molecular chaperone